MSSLSWLRWTLFYFHLLWMTPPAQSVEVLCTVAGPVGALHPVQVLLERFGSGPGCAARERGTKETHVIAVGRVTNSPENKVTVLLKQLSLSSPLRALHLLLSSKVPVIWWLEAERLPPNFPVQVKLSSHSTVKSASLHLDVQKVHSLPFHPHALHQWALKRHGNLSSMTHTTHANRVYVSLGQDPSLSDECYLHSLFLSHNYMTSDLQQQEVQGCSNAPAGGISPEVHVIKLHSAGSGLCGSLRVEVVVSLVPLVANSKAQNVVLILSSMVPVNWAITAHGVRGHVSVQFSYSLSPIFPPEPSLTLSSTLHPDLSTVSDTLVWANKSGYSEVTSYTEADLANRFVIQLAATGTDAVAVINPPDVRAPWAEEQRLRQWLNNGDGARGGGSFTVQCEDGQLSVAMDQHILQNLSVAAAAVTLRDAACKAQSNGSHILLVFPVISCGTEVLLSGHQRRLEYKNMLLLWRDNPQTILALKETERKSRSPQGIQFSCVTSVAALPSPACDEIDKNPLTTGPVPWAHEGSVPGPGIIHLPTPKHRSGPLLILKLFVTEKYEQRRIGPCVISADQRVYVEISAKGVAIDVLEVKSCVVSPLSDRKGFRFWTVIRDGCSSEPSLTLMKTDEQVEEVKGELEMEKEDRNRLERGKSCDVDVERRGKEAPGRMKTNSTSMGAEEDIKPLRFSFILRPIFNESMQFLHCSLRLCASEPSQPMMESVKTSCQSGTRIPPLVFTSIRHQCELRNLYRPMVVTQPLTSALLRPTTGQRTKNISLPPVTSPYPEHSSSVEQTRPLMAAVFAAFVMGVVLMGGLWCIHSYTANPLSLGETHLGDLTHGDSNICNAASPSDQSTSCV